MCSYQTVGALVINHLRPHRPSPTRFSVFHEPADSSQARTLWLEHIAQSYQVHKIRHDVTDHLHLLIYTDNALDLYRQHSSRSPKMILKL